MHLSGTPKAFLKFFIAFLKSTSNFEHFEKKDETHNSGISKIVDFESRGYLNIKKVLFQNTLRQSTY